MNAIAHISHASVSPVALSRGWNVIEGGTAADDGEIADSAVEAAGNLSHAALVEAAHEAEALACDDEIAEPAEIAGRATIGRDALTQAFGVIKRVVEARNTIPILSNARIEASDGIMIVTATDMDLQISVMMDAQVESAFQTTAPAHLLESILKKAAKTDEVLIVTDPENSAAVLHVGGKARYSLATLPIADFPELQPGEFPHRFTMPGKQLWDMIDGTITGISTEETRYYLNGIFLHVRPAYGNEAHKLRMVTTDGHRLYRMEIDAPEGAEPGMGGISLNDHMPGVIVPRNTIDLIYKLTKGKACPDTVEIAVSPTKVRFTFGNVEILSKLVDGTFPDYERVIPTGNENVMTFARDLMAEALQSVTLISSERGRAVKLSIAGGFCDLIVNNPDAGSATARIDCGWASAGEEAPVLEIGFNGRYLENLLDDAGAGTITVELGDAGDPAVFRGPREDWMAVLMPMRV